MPVIAMLTGTPFSSPALGVKGTPKRSDVQRPSTAKPCGKIDIASNLDASTAIAAAADGTVTMKVQNCVSCYSPRLSAELIDAELKLTRAATVPHPFQSRLMKQVQGRNSWPGRSQRTETLYVGDLNDMILRLELITR
jgi:hypothetical protein